MTLDSLFSLTRRRALLVIGGLALAACNDTGVARMIGIKRYRAEDFFVGRKLEIARAIEAGDMTAVRSLAPGVDLSAPGNRNMTLMWFAMLPGTPGHPNYEAVRTLVSLGVDPETQIAQGIGSALEYTFITRSDPDDRTGLLFLQAMLDGGLSPNYLQPHGSTLLQRAAGPGGTLEHVKLLLQRGADINARDSIGGTALHEAINTRLPEIALYLVGRGADVETHRTNGVSVTWSVHTALDGLQPSPLRSQFEQLRDLTVARGAKWPPDPPEVVRERVRAQGLTPAVPPGHKR